jgi:polysaccharide pyruvyl transferase WcaK-like protein
VIRCRRSKRRGIGAGPPRIGLFGVLGAGNIGNDASLESLLSYLRQAHPQSVLDAMCISSERLTELYGIPAVDLSWRGSRGHRPTSLTLLGIAKSVEAFRIAAWVRRHEVVIVPGAGVLEASLPVRPWETPYALLVLSVFGKLFRTKVALVSVGANSIDHRLTRWLSNAAARLAFYRSYRDTLSHEAMRQRGLDVSHDRVYADLVFAPPVPPADPGEPERVAVGVMNYCGSNDDRRRSDAIQAAYLEKMNCFVGWLVDRGRRVTLITGDSINDSAIAEEMVSSIRSSRPGLDSTTIVADRATSLQQLMRAIQPVSTVVAIRYHNVITALKLAKPTISIGYSEKHYVLMSEMGLAGYYQSANTLDIDLLVEQFTELETRSHVLRRAIQNRREERLNIVRDQFADISAVLLSTSGGARSPDLSGPAIVRGD